MIGSQFQLTVHYCGEVEAGTWSTTLAVKSINAWFRARLLSEGFFLLYGPGFLA